MQNDISFGAAALMLLFSGWAILFGVAYWWLLYHPKKNNKDLKIKNNTNAI